jgi:CO/xanthine dehydrogenase FAD-binding subunit
MRPATLEEALAGLAARPRTLLAGGTDHYPSRVTQAPDEDILDVTAIPGLRAIEAGGDHWWIPCQATWSDVLSTPLPPVFAGLKDAARQVGGRQVQNAGTVAGNVCNASPAADGIPCLLSLDACVELASIRGRRLIPLSDFVLGPRQTARQLDEMVLGVRVPRRDVPAQSSFLKLGARRYLVISIVIVAAVAEFAPDGRVARARIAVGACSPRAERLSALETALIGTLPDPALVLPEHLASLDPIDDVRGTASYRRAAAVELVRRAVGALGTAEAVAA